MKLLVVMVDTDQALRDSDLKPNSNDVAVFGLENYPLGPLKDGH